MDCHSRRLVCPNHPRHTIAPPGTHRLGGRLYCERCFVLLTLGKEGIDAQENRQAVDRVIGHPPLFDERHRDRGEA